MGGGGSTTSTSYTSSLPEYAEPYFINMMDRAENASLQPYAAYQGDRTANTTAAQQSAYNQIGGLQEPEQLGQATGLTQAATAASLAGTGSYQSQDVNSTYDPEQFGAQQAAQYMSPYQQNVTDSAIAKAQNMYMTERNGRDANAAKVGAFGGSRQGLMESAALNNFNTQASDLQYKGMQDSYTNAQQQFGADRTAQQNAAQMQLAADTSNQSADAQAAQIRQSGYSAALQGANQLGTLGATEQQMALERANALNTVGKEQQATTQKDLDQQYADFTNARDAERNNLTFYSGILRGTNGVLGQDSTTSAPSPSMASQLGGLGIAGAGLYGTATK